MAKSEGYLPISSSELDIGVHPAEAKPKSRLQKTVQGSVIVLSVLAALGLGYSFGLQHSYAATATTILPAGDVHYYMQFNKTFPQRPNEESDAAWASLFPEKLGFVQHPELAPDVASIAVFHELHCLNMLRQAFWASVDGKLAEMGDESREKNHRTSHHHVRHCFEYLRQSLICLADSNLEMMNYTARGISGWQTERTCRNFEELSDWSNEWGITRKEALHNHDLAQNFVDEGDGV
ncbi:hypothetical protein CC77DRAFT_1059630 [Alternaria alternata]|uniref:Tat pathway signal sequence n=2 Tax=Alternaria alternata complex TaxID=187734 RepID=A0A177DUU2_ALTAL|nr:hypothetical protein CC77DRAFT_1059630 [Alternaria alternata]RYN34513.1 hypothetical protein AA0115_g2594 [Alternaria tenuissima]OAG22752.1 hypothetical protein CC77DRAFT_1059630 [Alternaria alternata]OWY46340.1 hypothetical protein AALT_g2323 [Alternaria alternata]RYN67857.1 hypothetical protein AA0118_g1857 [Alternaria tenuissima]RYN80775.1 hypothetical protein AA0117_g2862 [Alternaria alternata]